MKKRRWERPAPLFNLRAGAAFATAQKIVENAQYNVPEITIAAGKVSTQAKAILRTVESCNPEPFAAMVPAMPEDRTWVVETGSPYMSAAAIVGPHIDVGHGYRLSVRTNRLAVGAERC